MKLRKAMCATCPWRVGSPYADLVPILEMSAKREASRICHSTGSNAINQHTGKPSAICRGARNFQLRYLHVRGFLTTPTDKAWLERCESLGINPDNQ